MEDEGLRAETQVLTILFYFMHEVPAEQIGTRAARKEIPCLRKERAEHGHTGAGAASEAALESFACREASLWQGGLAVVTSSARTAWIVGRLVASKVPGTLK